VHARRTSRVPARVAVAAALGVTALLSVATSSALSAPTDSITIAASSAPISLDPAKNGNTADLQLYMDLAYEPLISLAPDGSFKPALATSWKYGPGNRSFDLTLRPNVKFSDGTPLTADAVVQSINHEKTANGPVAVYVNVIKSATATGPLTVHLDLVEPDPDVPLVLTQRMLIGDIISPKAAADPTILATESAGAGPYMIDSSQTVSGDHYTYVPNPNYYDQSAIHFKTFTIKVITNPDTALNALKSGQIAYAQGSSTTAPQAQAAGLAVYSTLSSWYGALLFDRNGTVDKPLKSQLVRQALNYATDRVGITKALFGKYGRASDEISLPGYETAGYDPKMNNYYAYNLTKAKALLAKAGYAKGFTLHMGATPNFGNGVAMAQALASSWAKIGVKVKILSYPTVNQIVAPWAGKKLPIVNAQYDGQPMYIEQGQALAANAGLFNPFKTADPTLTSLIAKAKKAVGVAAETKAWNAVEDRIVTLAWFVPVASGSYVYFADKKLLGIGLSTTSFGPDPVLWHY
jgi:peptide/nickel transport system substrate-binding protein